jgi:hypothetical protein
VAFSGLSSSSLLLAALAAGPLAGQSTQLTRLETAAPAAAIEPLASAAWLGWGAAWVVPAAGGTSVGVLGGVEQSGFASVSSAFAVVRFRQGPLWQLAFGQTRVADLFDPDLLTQFPELGSLHVSATEIGADVVFAAGSSAALSLGGRYERDELVGDVTNAWVLRSSGFAHLPLAVTGSVTLERALSGPRTGAGRATAALGRRLIIGVATADLGVGLRAGDIWVSGASSRAASAAVRVTVRDAVSLSAALGAERPPFGVDGWQGYATFGLGLKVGAFAADVRRGGQGDAQAAPTGVSFLFSPH